MIKHYSQNIQNVIQRELFAAKKSIKICVAWFTNDLLFQPLILQLNMGVKVELILNKDEINLSDSNDVDFDQFVENGGCLYWNTTDKLLHHKFCIIDDRVVITGSYNWTNKAEYNYEDITVCTEDSESINHYQKIFDKLSQEFPLLKSSETLQQKKNITSRQEQAYTCSIKYITTDGKIIDVSCDKFPDGVKIISNTYRNGLGEMVFDRNITTIGEWAFENCGSLTSITIPDSVTTIGNYAFRNCSNLTTITIPDSVTTIGWDAFYGCSSLTSVTIPDSVTEIENLAFCGCSNLTCVNIKISNLAKYCAKNCMHKIEGTHHLFIGKTEITKLTIPDSVKTIGGGAFENCSNLTSITIPDSVTEIGERAFSRCSSLISVIIPDSVIEIGESAFRVCSSLTTITIPDSVKTIGSSAFSGCSSLANITIPDSVTEIGKLAFYNCSSLTSITIPDSVTTIEYSAFEGCSSLASITIPDSVKTIGGSAFENCSSLTSITIPDSVTTIGGETFKGCRSLTSVIIPDNVTEIGENAFRVCSSLTTITIPDSVKTIGSSAFSGCSSLASITIPDSVSKICDGVFYGCDSLKHFDGKFAEDNGRCLIVDGRLVAFALNCGLTEYTIPSNVTSIGGYVFRGSKRLTKLYVTKNVDSIGEYALCESLNELIFESSIPPFIIF